MEDLDFSASTVGNDVVERLSDAEGDCLRDTLDDDSYGRLLVSPLASIRGTPMEAGLLGCLTHDNVIVVGNAIVDTVFGGSTAESRECILAANRENPGPLYQVLGLEREGLDASPDAVAQMAVQFFQCMTARELARWFLNLWEGMIEASPTLGRDFVERLTADELNCANEALGAEDAERLLDESPFQVWRSYPKLEGCFDQVRLAEMFAFFISEQIGGVEASSYDCMVEFTEKDPDFLDFIVDGLDGLSSRDDGELGRLTQNQFVFFNCLEDDEQQRVQNLFFSATARHRE